MRLLLHFFSLSYDLLSFFDSLMFLSNDFLFLLEKLIIKRCLFHPFFIDIIMLVDTLHDFCPVTTTIFSLPAMRLRGTLLFVLILQFMLLDLFLVMLNGLFEIDFCFILLRSLIQVFTLFYVLQHKLQLLLNLQGELISLPVTRKGLLGGDIGSDVVVGVGTLLEERQYGGVSSLFSLAAYLRTIGVLFHARQVKIWFFPLCGEHLLIIEIRNGFLLAHVNKQYQCIIKVTLQHHFHPQLSLSLSRTTSIGKDCPILCFDIIGRQSKWSDAQRLLIFGIQEFIIFSRDQYFTIILVIVFQIQNILQMFQSFLTAIDNHPSSKRPKHDDSAISGGKQGKLRQAIRCMIMGMMPSREICTQAALNIGLPSSILDFEKVLKFVSSESSASSLSFTYMQLKTLQKECAKLKKAINFGDNPKDLQRSETRGNTRKETLISFNEESSKKQADSNEKLRKAIEQQMAFRIKLKNMNSNDKIEKKQELLKKRVEKAKSMNKRAFKIYKNYKQKQEKSYDFFKIEARSNEAPPPNLEVPPNLHEEKYISTMKQPTEDPSSQDKSCELLKVSILRSSFMIPSEKCKTAATKLRVRYNEPTQESDTRKSTIDRFQEYKKREQMTKSKKQEMERSKQQQALYRLIKKNERLIELEQKNQKEVEKQGKKIQKIQQDSLPKHATQLQEDFDNSIKDKCEQKLLKKEMQLQEQVNRIRQDLRTKQQRRQRHRQKQERQHQQKMGLNQLYLQNYLTRCKTIKQNDYRHQMTIKRRHEMQLEKENDSAILHKLTKLTDQELLKSIERLNNADHNYKSLFNLNAY